MHLIWLEGFIFSSDTEKPSLNFLYLKLPGKEKGYLSFKKMGGGVGGLHGLTSGLSH